MAIVSATDASFAAEALQASVPVLVDFWGPQCTACRAMGPILEELAAEYEGRLKVVMVNAHENHATAARLGVRAIPNLVLLRGGTVAQQIVGAVPRSRLVAAIEAVLG